MNLERKIRDFAIMNPNIQDIGYGNLQNLQTQPAPSFQVQFEVFHNRSNLSKTHVAAI
jgi:hypothetical protein